MNGFGLKTMSLLFLSLLQKKQLLMECSAMTTFQQSALQQDLSKGESVQACSRDKAHLEAD